MPRSVAQLCALQPLVPSFRVCLSEAASFGGFLVLSFVLPWPYVCFQVHLPGSVPCQQIAFSAWSLLRVWLPPLDCRFSWHPGAAGALAVPSLRLRVSMSSSLSAWSFPFRGLSLFLAFVPLLEALSELLTHSFPCSCLVVALYECEKVMRSDRIGTRESSEVSPVSRSQGIEENENLEYSFLDFTQEN